MDGYRPYKGKHRRKSDRLRGEERIKRLELRLTVCLAIVAAVSAARLMFPAFFTDVRAKAEEVLGVNADFRSAAYAMSEALNGEASFSEALSRAYRCVAEGESDITEAA